MGNWMFARFIAMLMVTMMAGIGVHAQNQTRWEAVGGAVVSSAPGHQVDYAVSAAVLVAMQIFTFSVWLQFKL